MKIIKLFLLLSLGLWAEFKLDIPNEIDTEQLQDVIENGWNDKNETLNNFIIKYGEKTFPQIVEKIIKPIVMVESNREIGKGKLKPEVVLSLDDYRFILAYMKYLESIKKFVTVQTLYIEMLEGIDNVQDGSLLALFYRQIYSKIVLDGLEESLKHQVFTGEAKEKLKDQLRNSSLSDKKTFFDAIEYEKIVSRNQVENTFMKQSKESEYINVEQLSKNVLRQFEAYQDLYYKKLIEAIKSGEAGHRRFEAYIGKKKEKHSSKWNMFKFNFYKLIAEVEHKIGIKGDDTFISNHTAQFLALYLMVPSTTYFSSYSRYIKAVKRRKRFIEALNKM